MHGLDSGFPAGVKAALGPTNIGKTHLAMEPMLGHASGIIGFPLRPLAHENNDRMVARKPVRDVPLISGEEKHVLHVRNGGHHKGRCQTLTISQNAQQEVT